MATNINFSSPEGEGFQPSPIGTIKIIKADNVPQGSVHNGYEDHFVCELIIKTHIILVRRERWLTPVGKPLVAAFPEGVSGGFGPGLKVSGAYPPSFQPGFDVAA